MFQQLCGDVGTKLNDKRPLLRASGVLDFTVPHHYWGLEGKEAWISGVTTNTSRSG